MLRETVRRSDATRDIDSEEALLGSLILDPGGMVYVDSKIERRDFSSDACGKLYTAIKMLFDARKPFGDMVILVSHLKQVGDFEKVGGLAYIAKLTSTVVPYNVEFYVENILRASRLREIDKVMREVIEAIHDHDGDEPPEPDTVIQLLDAKISGVGLRRSNSVAATLRQLGEQRLQLIVRKRHTSDQPAETAIVPTGVLAIDNRYGGFRSTNNVVIAARSGEGKSALAKQIAGAMSYRGLNVRFVSLEMSASEVSDRVLAERSGVNGKYISSGDVSVEEEMAICDVVESCESNLVIDAPIGKDATWERIASEARLQKATKGLDVLVIDYIQLVAKSDQRTSDYDHLTRVSHEIKQLARELGIITLTLSQLNRAADSGGEKRRPRLSDLSSASAIGNDADVVLFLHRDDDASRNFWLIVGKWRGDSPGAFEVRLDGARTRFLDREDS
jgi:replicative DNA helicase